MKPSSRKRPRKGEEDRPDPPPPAPPSLIRLLKKDAKVLKYFKALQVNLVYDVEKWKKRAKSYQDELEDVKASLAQKEIEAAADPRKELDEIPKGVTGATSPQNRKHPTKETSGHIEDSAFDFELSSSSSSSSDEESFNPGPNDRSSPVMNRPKNHLEALRKTERKARESFQFNVTSDNDDDDNPIPNDTKNDDRRAREDQIPATTHHPRISPKTFSSPERMNGGVGEAVERNNRTTSREESAFSTDRRPNRISHRVRLGWKYLRRADDFLKQIGICLATSVVVEDSDEENDNEEEIETLDSQTECAMGNFSNDSTIRSTTETADAAFDKSTKANHISYIRRSDNAVLNDMLSVIKEWTRLKTTVAFSTGANVASEEDGMPNETSHHQYFAFTAVGCIPCFETVAFESIYGRKPFVGHTTMESPSPRIGLPQHPAVKGVDLLVKALSWIDTFGSILDEIQIHNGTMIDDQGTDFPMLASVLEAEGSETSISGESSMEPSSIKMFVIGMKNRHSMVQALIASLEGEICDAWPVQDRFARSSNAALHYKKNQSDSEKEESESDCYWNKTNVAMKRKLIVDSKNMLRLATLAERSVFARIVVSIRLQRSDPSSALDFLFRYLLSTAPSSTLEDHPNLPPVQSLCLIEAILTTRFDGTFEDDSGRSESFQRSHRENRRLLDFLMDKTMLSGTEYIVLVESFQLTLAVAASIHRLRATHHDSRVSEPGHIEFSAFLRLEQQISEALKKHGCGGHSSKMNLVGEDSTHLDACNRLANLFIDDITSAMDAIAEPREGSDVATKTKIQMLPIVLILCGDDRLLRGLFSNWSQTLCTSPSMKCLFIMATCAKAMRQLEIRRLDSYRAIVSSPATTVTDTAMGDVVKEFVESLLLLSLERASNLFEYIGIEGFSILLWICLELADGESAMRLMHWLMNCAIQCKASTKISPQETAVGRLIDRWSVFPMVRVINLERRKDRMASFVSQAMHAKLWMIRGVIPPNQWKSSATSTESATFGMNANDILSCIGTYAIDGSVGSPSLVERKLIAWMEQGDTSSDEESLMQLDSLVKPQWRPNDLRAFDVNAPDDPNIMVSLSPSEKACALSHIATWKGIAMLSPSSKLMWTGFARGDPLHDESRENTKDNLIPCPVALVLEDDAVLVDRFKERLDELLEELPRDFHYCALGYAKPKEAPLVAIPGCEHIKLPTMTWYLTGYLLSKTGAEYLLNHLPLAGPVDTWIGRKMILGSNWENEYGHRLGIGDAPQVGPESSRPELSRKEIRLCVKFRAYCASIPLCDQKVRSAVATGASANRHEKPFQNWRLRDSDITYSGNLGAGNRLPGHKRKPNG